MFISVNSYWVVGIMRQDRFTFVPTVNGISSSLREVIMLETNKFIIN